MIQVCELWCTVFNVRFSCSPSTLLDSRPSPRDMPLCGAVVADAHCVPTPAPPSPSQFTTGAEEVTAACAEALSVGNPCDSWQDVWPGLIPRGTTFCVDGVDLDEAAAVNDTRGDDDPLFANVAFCCCTGPFCNVGYVRQSRAAPPACESRRARLDTAGCTTCSTLLTRACTVPSV
jgi:hypothetical protein